MVSWPTRHLELRHLRSFCDRGHLLWYSYGATHIHTIRSAHTSAYIGANIQSLIISIRITDNTAYWRAYCSTLIKTVGPTDNTAYWKAYCSTLFKTVGTSICPAFCGADGTAKLTAFCNA